MTGKNEWKERRALKVEIRRLRRENAYLRHRAASLGDRTRADNHAAPALALRAARLAGAQSLPEYLMLAMKTNRTFRLYDRTAFAVRQVFFFSRLWRLTRTAVAVLGIGAQVLLTIGILAVLIPALLALTLLFAVIVVLTARRWNRILERRLAGRQVIFILSPKPERESAYFRAMLRALSENATVILVSHSMRACGFSCARTLGDGMVRVHIAYYFTLMKKLRASSENIIKII